MHILIIILLYLSQLQNSLSSPIAINQLGIWKIGNWTHHNSFILQEQLQSFAMSRKEESCIEPNLANIFKYIFFNRTRLCGDRINQYRD